MKKDHIPENLKYIYIHYGLSIIIGSEIELPNDCIEMVDLQNMQSRDEITSAGYSILWG